MPRAWIASIRWTGTIEEPVVRIRRLERSAASQPGRSITAWMVAGTRTSWVGRSSTIARSVASASKRRCRITVPPHIEGGRGEDVEPAHMEHRKHRQHAVGIGEAGIVDAVVGGDLDRLLGEHRPLGMAGGARGVDQQAGGLRPRIRVAVFALRRLRVARDCVNGDKFRRRSALRRPAREIGVVGVRDQEPGRRVAQDISEFRRDEAPVKRRENRSDPRAGEVEGSASTGC